MTVQPAAPTLAEGVRVALIARLTAMGDDELLLGHRDSEWTGHGPLLEEDIALANLAQDEIGHAVLWYGLRQALDGSVPDDLAFRRDPEDFRSCLLVELPRGDWAFTMLRQFLFDCYEAEALPRLARSSYAPLAEAAAKALREELFHLRHAGLWVQRLGLGTEESRSRAVAALERLWPELGGLLTPLPGDLLLAAERVLPDWDTLTAATVGRARQALAAASLDPGHDPEVPEASGREVASPHRVELLATMQSVARSDPEAVAW
ncbi:MAG TPA: 1,2-phenylacetyl-CoA epoxidase subunit PaaC [Trueperaceae bacterium]|nr:1,2-phenylacetyl-CoA epoxidase subunit PaaC [Trueperaceae bacterium]